MSKKGAYKTGGGTGNRNKKNEEMAARMKRDGVERKIMRDPISHNIVPVGSHPSKWGR